MVGHNVSFVPLAVESLGGWSHEAALQISTVGRLVGQRLGTTPAEAVFFTFVPEFVHLFVERKCINVPSISLSLD